MDQHRAAPPPGRRRRLATVAALGAVGATVVVPARPAAAETVDITAAHLAFAPVRSPDAREPDVGSGSASRAAPVAVALSVLATALVLAWYLVRRKRTDESPGPDRPGGAGSAP